VRRRISNFDRPRLAAADFKACSGLLSLLYEGQDDRECREADASPAWVKRPPLRTCGYADSPSHPAGCAGGSVSLGERLPHYSSVLRKRDENKRIKAVDLLWWRMQVPTSCFVRLHCRLCKSGSKGSQKGSQKSHKTRPHVQNSQQHDLETPIIHAGKIRVLWVPSKSTCRGLIP
jgi:hypothetical protein